MVLFLNLLCSETTLRGDTMAYLWAYSDDPDHPDPMIGRPVGDGQVNEITDVYLVQVLLNIYYRTHRIANLSPLPGPGNGWDTVTYAYLADFQVRVMKQKHVTVIVSPPPTNMSFINALRKKYTMPWLTNSAKASLNAQMGESTSLVKYLVDWYPFLQNSLRTIRKGNTWTQPTGGTSEDFKAGGNPGIESGRAG